MKIEQLKQVICIYESGSINKASQNLFISQPCISSSLKALETELQQKIFIRSHTGISLTEFGVVFMQNAQKIVSYADQIERAAKDLSRQMIPLSFSVSVYHLRFAHVVFQNLLKKYQDASTNFRYHQASLSEVITDVHNRTTELGLISIADIDKEKWLAKLALEDLCYAPIYKGVPNAMCATDATYHTQENGALLLKDLRDRPLVIIAERLPLFDAINKKMRHILGAKTVIEVNDRSTAHEFIQNNNAYACVVRFDHAYRSINFFEYATTYPIAELPFSFEIGWIYRKDSCHSPLAQEYIAAIQNLLQ